jgi:hypothetical protein
MLYITSLTTPYAPTNSDRRRAQQLSTWRNERAAARHARNSPRRPRLRLRIAG